MPGSQKFCIEGAGKVEKWLFRGEKTDFRSSKRLLEPAPGTSVLPKISLKLFQAPIINRKSTAHFWTCFRPKKGAIRMADYRGPKNFRLIFGKKRSSRGWLKKSLGRAKNRSFRLEKVTFPLCQPLQWNCFYLVFFAKNRSRILPKKRSGLRFS